MKTFIIMFYIFFALSLNAQISPFTDHDWIIEKIVTSDNIVIMADQLSDGSYDTMYLFYDDFLNQGYFYEFSGCEGLFDFNDSAQTFNIKQYACIVTTNHTTIADHFVNVFILQEGGETQTPEGPVYGPFSYNFTFSDDLVYLHITNQAGSVATFYATNLSQSQFLKKSISIYPNPVKYMLQIESGGIDIEKVKVYDLNGRLVEEYQINNNQIFPSNLQSGVYILNIETSIGILNKQFIKE